MDATIFSCSGGQVLLPDRTLTLVNREDGGNLIVKPSQDVWERCELTPIELTLWSFLVAATGQAMLDVLPQLEGGCINYWEAGNWALNHQADPVAAKTAREYRKVHMHLLGRSRTAIDPSWRWGEAPKFPNFAERFVWAAKNERLRANECQLIVRRVNTILLERYAVRRDEIDPWTICDICDYPAVVPVQYTRAICVECQTPTSAC